MPKTMRSVADSSFRLGTAAGFPVNVCRSASNLLDTLDATKRLACGGVPQARTRRLGTSTGWWTAHSGRVCALREEPESEPEPARQATIPTTTSLENGNGTGERGADSSPTPCEETDRQPRPAAHCLACTSYAVAIHREHAAPLRTCWHAHTYEADHAGPCPATNPKEDEWMLSMHWPVGHAWPPAEIEGALCGEVVTKLRCVAC